MLIEKWRRYLYRKESLSTNNPDKTIKFSLPQSLLMRLIGWPQIIEESLRLNDDAIGAEVKRNGEKQEKATKNAKP